MREKQLFDQNWNFHLGDIKVPFSSMKGPTYTQSKTEHMKWGPAAWHYDDEADSYAENKTLCTEKWETVNLPHDYIIEQEPNPKNNQALGYFDYQNAWYRKKFTLPETDRGKRISLYFEGIASHAEVYINGSLVVRNFCSYTSFEADISDFVRFDQENAVAVYVKADEHEGWWYGGGGIYRHVWLVKTAQVSVDLYGVYIHPEKVRDGFWKVPVDTTLRNDSDKNCEIAIRSVILENQQTCESVFCIKSGEKTTFSQTLEVKKPNIWDTDTPNLYTLQTTVIMAGQEIDKVETRFGFRTIRFDAEKGFFLNEKPVKIKGVCCHQDYGLTGIAVPDRVQRYKLKLMKEMGANGYRTVHYPHSETTMDALDEMGFLVMDETRWFTSSREGQEQLTMLIKRDRNRPSVIMWSIGNEEYTHKNDIGYRITQTLNRLVRKLDRTRPVMSAVSTNPIMCPVMELSDLVGVNYNLDQYDALHKKFPEKPFVSTECCATGTTRSWYVDDCLERGYLPAYDRDTNEWFRGREYTWKFIMERPWVSGAYQWAGIEHRGETIWPRLCSQSGAVDLYLQKKDAFYQNLSHWTDIPMVHILPHWNLAGREGEEIKVLVYTNCEEVELFQDGKSLGQKKIEKYGHGEWAVIYRPGTLSAVGYIQDRLAAETKTETTAEPVELRLRLEDSGGTDDCALLTCYCVDEQGRFVPDASPLVSFECNSLGWIAGTGSDISDHVPPICPDRKMRAGLCSVLVRTKQTHGTLKVYARAEGLKPCRSEIQI